MAQGGGVTKAQLKRDLDQEVTSKCFKLAFICCVCQQKCTKLCIELKYHVMLVTKRHCGFNLHCIF